MKLSVSNIAWNPADDDAIAAVLRAGGATGVEIAPTKWRAEPLSASAADVAAYKAHWAERGLAVAAMQSLVYGRPELQLFGDAHARRMLSDHLAGMLALAGGLGAGAVVFGSPRNRTRGSLPDAEATQIAAEFFHDLGPVAEAHEVVVCLEPVPARYGADFVHTPSQALALCRAANHPWIRVNADLGAMILAGDDPVRVLREARGHIGHFHASEPEFVELADAPVHERAASGLRDAGYEGWVSIEMRMAPDGDCVGSVARAVAAARRAYDRVV